MMRSPVTAVMAATLMAALSAAPARSQDADAPPAPAGETPESPASTDETPAPPPREPTTAEELEEEFKGTYLGAGFVYGHEQFSGTGGNDVDDSAGFSAWIGHYFVPQVGVEVQWEWIDKFKIDDFFDEFGRGDGDLETHSLTVNARVLPFAEVDNVVARYVQPFLRGGAGFVAAEIEDRFNNDTNDATFVLRGGGGIQWMFTRRFSFNTSAEYVFPTEDIEGVDYEYLSITGAFQFVY